MKTKLFKSNQRGHADYGWLQANYSFSFANYYDAEKQQFGALRVLNDDFIKGGAGFGEHPHRNMEIISIPLKGGLMHKDSMNKTWIPLMAGEVQVMSAGTGVMHAEKNESSVNLLNLFQIWIIPESNGVEPSYGQKMFSPEDRDNELQIIVNSYKDASEGQLSIHQDALISRMDLSQGKTYTYKMKSPYHGVYLMVISGELEIGDTALQTRDALSIWQTDHFRVQSSKDSELLFIEIPMHF